jgi:hypothetical protein
MKMARPYQLLPGKPAHPIGLAIFPRASRPAPPCGKRLAEGIRRWRLPSRNQFISSRLLTVRRKALPA